MSRSKKKSRHRQRSPSRSPSPDLEHAEETDDSDVDEGVIVMRRYRLLPYCCREFRDCMIAAAVLWWALGKLNERHHFLDWR